MNDEIKEILDKLKDDDWYDELDLTGDKWIELKQTETKQILDYIANLQTIEREYSAILSENAELQHKISLMEEDIRESKEINGELQQENERLKEENNNKAMNDYAHAIDESWYRELYDDYKSRCEKASEYIKEHYPTSTINDQDDKYNLLNILQNGRNKGR